MLPDQVQLTVAEGISSKKLEYDALKAKIKLMANVQSDYAVDIGEMQCYDEDVNVEAVEGAERERSSVLNVLDVWWQPLWEILSKGLQQGSERFRQKRREGQGQGQREADRSDVWVLLDLRREPLSRECPKGERDGVKGGGKAMKCYSCSGVGHRAAQCPTSVREIEYDEDEEGHGHVESVSEGWDIFG